MFKHALAIDVSHHHLPVHLYCAYYVLNKGAFQDSHTKNQNVSVR